MEVDAVAGTATVRVDFTLRNDVVSAQCSLGVNFPAVDCELNLATSSIIVSCDMCAQFYPFAGSSGSITFTGIPANTREPLPFLVRAFNQLGDEVGNITRNVRIGKTLYVNSVYLRSVKILSLITKYSLLFICTIYDPNYDPNDKDVSTRSTSSFSRVALLLHYY